MLLPPAPPKPQGAATKPPHGDHALCMCENECVSVCDLKQDHTIQRRSSQRVPGVAVGVLLPGGTFYKRCGVRVYRDTVVPSTARASGRTAFWGVSEFRMAAIGNFEAIISTRV